MIIVHVNIWCILVFVGMWGAQRIPGRTWTYCRKLMTYMYNDTSTESSSHYDRCALFFFMIYIPATISLQLHDLSIAYKYIRLFQVEVKRVTWSHFPIHYCYGHQTISLPLQINIMTLLRYLIHQMFPNKIPFQIIQLWPWFSG